MPGIQKQIEGAIHGKEDPNKINVGLDKSQKALEEAKKGSGNESEKRNKIASGISHDLAEISFLCLRAIAETDARLAEQKPGEREKSKTNAEQQLSELFPVSLFGSNFVERLKGVADTTNDRKTNIDAVQKVIDDTVGSWWKSGHPIPSGENEKEEMWYDFWTIKNENSRYLIHNAEKFIATKAKALEAQMQLARKAEDAGKGGMFQVLADRLSEWMDGLKLDDTLMGKLLTQILEALRTFGGFLPGISESIDRALLPKYGREIAQHLADESPSIEVLTDGRDTRALEEFQREYNQAKRRNPKMNTTFVSWVLGRLGNQTKGFRSAARMANKIGYKFSYNDLRLPPRTREVDINAKYTALNASKKEGESEIDIFEKTLKAIRREGVENDRVEIDGYKASLNEKNDFSLLLTTAKTGDIPGLTISKKENAQKAAEELLKAKGLTATKTPDCFVTTKNVNLSVTLEKGKIVIAPWNKKNEKQEYEKDKANDIAKLTKKIDEFYGKVGIQGDAGKLDGVLENGKIKDSAQNKEFWEALESQVKTLKAIESTTAHPDAVPVLVSWNLDASKMKGVTIIKSEKMDLNDPTKGLKSLTLTKDSSTLIVKNKSKSLEESDSFTVEITPAPTLPLTDPITRANIGTTIQDWAHKEDAPAPAPAAATPATGGHTTHQVSSQIA